MGIQRVGEGDEAEFAGLVRIFEASLPATERKGKEALRAMLARTEYMFLAAIMNERVAGFAIAIALLGSDAALLEYMAVDEPHRGRGIGEALFHAVSGWPGIADRVLLIEVDSDREDSAEHEERARRKRFYRKFGARELAELRYIMPPVAAAVPPPMELLVYRRELPPSIEKHRVRAWLEACYVQVYGAAAADPRIHEMLAICEEYVALVS